jgi:hypothetical protein
MMRDARPVSRTEDLSGSAHRSAREIAGFGPSWGSPVFAGFDTEVSFQIDENIRGTDVHHPADCAPSTSIWSSCWS